MQNSSYASRFEVGQLLLKQLRDEQVGRLARMTEQDRDPTLQEWHELAKAETAVKDRYRGRFLFELIQNAHDAIQETETIDGDLERLVHFDLTEHSLLVANTGKPFDSDNVRAICRLHRTTKSATKQIGHKGIGFKSVLEISPRPEVYSISSHAGYAFGFDGQKFRDDVEQVLGKKWDLNNALPILRTPYARHLKALNPDERQRIESLLDDGYVSVVRLPWETDDVFQNVQQRIEQDLKPTLLLFMPYISRIEVMQSSGLTWMQRQERSGKVAGAREVILTWQHGDEAREESRWLVLGPIQRQLTDRSLVPSNDEAWKDVTALSFSLAFPLERETGNISISSASCPFYVYFPTEEYSGVGFAIHADFQVSDDRKHLDTLKLNEWLLEEICLYLGDEGMKRLQAQWGYQVELVNLLAPIGTRESAFARSFMDKYLSVLSETEFVPVEGRRYRAPVHCCFPPPNANYEVLRKVFPFSKLEENSWSYPIDDVVQFELGRTSPFLLRPELGAKSLTSEDIANWLDTIDRPPVDQARELVGFLTDWWANSNAYQRSEIEEALESCAIFPTTSGWLITNYRSVFQANMRSSIDEIAIPQGFDFAVIVRSVYPEQSATQSNVFHFFNKMGAKDYENRVIVQSILLPVLTNLQAFLDLHEVFPLSIILAYRLLMRYFAEERSVSTFAQQLSMVIVPAIRASDPDTTEWTRAGECYLGPDWPGGEDLFRLFSSFDDCSFLSGPSVIGLSEDDDLEEWRRFWIWIGVADSPRTVQLSGHVSLGNDIRRAPPGVNAVSWSEYTQRLERKEVVQCTKGHTRNLREVNSLHHFDKIVEEGDIKRIQILYHLILSHWDDEIGHIAYPDATCNRAYCPDITIDGFLLFQLRTTKWVPALSNGNLGLYAPESIWILGETEPSDVRKLLPTLPKELRTDDSSRIEHALGYRTTSTATIEDFVSLLRHFPEYFPLDPPDFYADSVSNWQRSVRAIFNWVCEHIQTGLTGWGDHAPDAPSGLSLLAYRGEQLCYVTQDSPDLAFPDDRRLAERWKHQCALFRVNDDWIALRKWLGVPDLSACVLSQWSHEGELIDESGTLNRSIQECIPYFMCLINETQTATYRRLLPRMRRISAHVFKRIVAKETFTRIPSGETIEVELPVHLEITDTSELVRGNLVRSAKINTTQEVLNNPDLLGDLIAEYVEIARLGDAFVLLYERDHDARLRYFRARGIDQVSIRSVFADFQTEVLESEDEDESVYETSLLEKKLIDKAVRNATAMSSNQLSELASVDDGPTLHLVEQSGAPSESVHPQSRTYNFPPLDLDNVPIPHDVTGSLSFSPSIRPSSSSVAAIKTGTVPNQQINDIVGRRGEQWAYEAERQRLASLGYDVESLAKEGKLRWVSLEFPTSSFDIQSIDGRAGSVEKTIYIEVKSTSGTSRLIRMSRREFEFGLRSAEAYWIYWVAHADDATPSQPQRYNNLAKMVTDNAMSLAIDTIALTLPAPSV